VKDNNIYYSLEFRKEIALATEKLTEHRPAYNTEIKWRDIK